MLLWRRRNNDCGNWDKKQPIFENRFFIWYPLFANAAPVAPSRTIGEGSRRIYEKLVEEMRNWEAKLDVAASNHWVKRQSIRGWSGQNQPNRYGQTQGQCPATGNRLNGREKPLFAGLFVPDFLWSRA